MHNTLNDQWDIELFLNVRDRIPVHGGLIINANLVEHGARRHARLHGHIAFHNVTLTPRVDLRICSETEADIATANGALNLIIQPSLIARQVQLINTRAGNILSDGLKIRHA